MANASSCVPSGPMSQVFFHLVDHSGPGSTVMQQESPLPKPSTPAPFGDPVDLQCPGGAVVPSMILTPAGVSFIIQIGLTRESVLMPQTADLAYVKQIACSIVDTKVRTTVQTEESGMPGKNVFLTQNCLDVKGCNTTNV